MSICPSTALTKQEAKAKYNVGEKWLRKHGGEPWMEERVITRTFPEDSRSFAKDFPDRRVTVPVWSEATIKQEVRKRISASGWQTDGSWCDKKGRRWLTLRLAFELHGLGDEVAAWGKSPCRYLVGANRRRRRVLNKRIKPSGPRAWELVTVYLEADLEEIVSKRNSPPEKRANEKKELRPSEWATAAQIWQTQNFGETALGYWVGRSSKHRPGQMALRTQDVPNPGRYGKGDIKQYFLPDLDDILAGKEGKPGTGRGPAAAAIRAQQLEDAKGALRRAIPDGSRAAGEVMTELAKLGIKRPLARKALKALRGTRVEEVRPGGGTLYFWRLPAAAVVAGKQSERHQVGGIPDMRFAELAAMKAQLAVQEKIAERLDSPLSVTVLERKRIIASDNAERDAYCYEQMAAGSNRASIRGVVNARDGWNMITTDGGITEAAKSHAERTGEAWPIVRQ